jgi:uncharacterized protein YerC
LNTVENHEESVEHSNRKLTYGRNAREFRRQMVLELDSQGYTYREIEAELRISKGTVSSDMAFLRKQAQDNLQHHIHDVIPEYHQKCLWGMKRILKQTLEIGEQTSDPKIKLEAMKIASECYRHIMDLNTNGSIVTDAMNRVTQIQKDVTVLQRLDESIKADEQEMTTTGVF